MAPINLLMIEDYYDHFEIFRQSLLLQRDFEFTVTHASTLAQADQILDDKRIDAIILDVNLPDSRGWSTVEHVVSRAPTVPVILNTATSDKEFAARALHAGVQDFITKGEYDPRLLGRLIRHAIERQQLLVQLSEAKQREHDLAIHDQLTGLLNRKAIAEVAANVIALARRTDSRVAVLFIDLDGFKIVNDCEGHQVGDAVLIETARRIRARLRESDYIFRVGGDEFVCLLRDTNRTNNVDLVAQQIIESINAPINMDGRDHFVGASIGISFFPDDSTDFDQLIQYADTAMYAAKEGGRNQFQYYDDQMQTASQRRLTQERELRHALSNRELQVYYQPIVDSATGKLAACEALMRWSHPKHGWLAASAFIDMAEESGLIFDIDEFVLREAVAQYDKWKAAGVDVPSIHVNISARDFMRPDFVTRVQRIVARSAHAPTWLELELTENSLMEFSNRTLNHILRLQDMGVRVSIDDFGMGYSSLYRLKRHPINTLKIDRSFISDLVRNQHDQAIVRAIVTLAKCMSMKVVAEGVETVEQVRLLNEFDCHLMQGYYYGKPMQNDQLSLIAQGSGFAAQLALH